MVVAAVSDATEIAPGVAIKHRTSRAGLMGRVRRIVGQRAECTWVRRRLPSFARLENLTVIPDSELIAHFEQQEALYDAIRTDPEYADLAPPAVTSDDNRRFLLGASA